MLWRLTMITSLTLVNSNIYYDLYTDKIPNIDVAISPQFELSITEAVSVSVILHYPTDGKIPLVNSELGSPIPTGLPPYTTPAGLANMTFTWLTDSGFLRSSDEFVSLKPGENRIRVTLFSCCLFCIDQLYMFDFGIDTDN